MTSEVSPALQTYWTATQYAQQRITDLTNQVILAQQKVREVLDASTQELTHANPFTMGKFASAFRVHLGGKVANAQEVVRQAEIARETYRQIVIRAQKNYDEAVASADADLYQAANTGKLTSTLGQELMGAEYKEEDAIALINETLAPYEAALQEAANIYHGAVHSN